MNIWIKAGIVTLSAGTIGGTTLAGYSHFSKNSFLDNLGISVLNLYGNSNEVQWKARLKELVAFKSELPDGLKDLKNGKKWVDLQAWCLSNSNNKFNKTTDKNYLNFETFCT